MTSLLTVIYLAGMLTASLCPGPLPLRSRAIPEMLKPAAVSRKGAPSARTQGDPSRRSKSALLRPRVRTQADEPTVVILYGSRPWSWM